MYVSQDIEGKVLCDVFSFNRWSRNISSVIKQKVFTQSFNVLSPVSGSVSISLGHWGGASLISSALKTHTFL